MIWHQGNLNSSRFGKYLHRTIVRSSELSEIMRIVRENRQIFREKWDEHFGR